MTTTPDLLRQMREALAETRAALMIAIMQKPLICADEILEAARAALAACDAYLGKSANSPHTEEPGLLTGDPACICRGNWRNIIAETKHQLGKDFRDDKETGWERKVNWRCWNLPQLAMPALSGGSCKLQIANRDL